MQKSPSGALVDLIRGRILAPIGVRGRRLVTWVIVTRWPRTQPPATPRATGRDNAFTGMMGAGV